LQTNDIISITIKAIDPKLVAMFNPTNEGNMQVNQNQDFILMVLQLMIMVPLEFLFGELNVIGYTLEEIRVRIEKLLAEYFNKEANILLPLNWVVLPSTEK
jgi:polysaccharide export outer membrane protein